MSAVQLELAQTRKIHLDGLRTGRAESTLGQRSMWRIVQLAEPFTEVFNIVHTVPVPSGCTLDDAFGSVAELIRRRESLRTRFCLADGRLYQRLEATEDLAVEIYPACGMPADELTGELTARLRATRFDLRCELPIRIAIGMADHDPVVIVLAISHLAADRLSGRVVEAELAALLAARSGQQLPPPPARARQPLEQAHYEQSAHGQRQGQRALDYWAGQLRQVPSTMFPWARQAPAGPRYLSGGLVSRAVTLAAAELARRCQTSTSIVILAAAAAQLSKQAGTDRCGVMLIAGNRLGPQLRDAVGTLTQSVLATIDTSSARFDDVIRSAWSATVQAYRSASYDDAALDALRTDIAAQRGAQLDLTFFFNDLRSSTNPPAASQATAERIRDACAETSFAWVGEHDFDHMKLLLELPEPESPQAPAVIAVMADTCVWPPDRAEAMLYEIERLLVEAATSSDELPDMRSSVIGVSSDPRVSAQ